MKLNDGVVLWDGASLLARTDINLLSGGKGIPFQKMELFLQV